MKILIGARLVAERALQGVELAGHRLWEGSMERWHVHGAVVVAVMASLLWGCGSGQMPVQPTPAATTTQGAFSLSGDVYDIAGRPLGGAKVEATSGPRSGVAATTDDTGRFSMPGTFTGAIAVTASKEGF